MALYRETDSIKSNLGKMIMHGVKICAVVSILSLNFGKKYFLKFSMCIFMKFHHKCKNILDFQSWKNNLFQVLHRHDMHAKCEL